MEDQEKKQKIAAIIDDFLNEINKIRAERDEVYHEIIKKIETEKLEKISKEIKDIN